MAPVVGLGTLHLSRPSRALPATLITHLHILKNIHLARHPRSSVKAPQSVRHTGRKHEVPVIKVGHSTGFQPSQRERTNQTSNVGSNQSETRKAKLSLKRAQKMNKMVHHKALDSKLDYSLILTPSHLDCGLIFSSAAAYFFVCIIFSILFCSDSFSFRFSMFLLKIAQALDGANLMVQYW